MVAKPVPAPSPMLIAQSPPRDTVSANAAKRRRFVGYRPEAEPRSTSNGLGGCVSKVMRGCVSRSVTQSDACKRSPVLLRKTQPPLPRAAPDRYFRPFFPDFFGL